MAGNRVAQLREASKLTRSELAQVIGEDEASIHEYESGEPLPPHVADKLAAMFGVSVSFLRGEG